MLSTLYDREIDLSRVRRGNESRRSTQNLILTDERNPLDKWQEEQAFSHWRCT
jgi:hypothetical protein